MLLRCLLLLLMLALPERALLAAGCFPVAAAPARLWPAALPGAAAVRLTFLGHSSFLLESAGGVTAVTDFNGYVRPALTPDIVTMNNAHSTHFTPSPDPAIPHVLRGWALGGAAEHDLVVEDMRVRSVPTAVHGRTGERALGNSMFVFEVADLCIAHLGHLHHRLLPVQLAELGQIDVVLAPIDGAYTMSQEEMLEVLRQIRAPLVIPMHYFGSTVLGRFVELARGAWDIDMRGEPELLLSRTTLPRRPTVVVLPGG
ncbi:MBL fold metallo-hydrolase [Marinimicrococcus flavescens]|uniref:MBL fold metallo-hydrolase n=1 Tax=Marinimicrococcus flavescens TaxID=3031815 RepID=A0AAP3V2S7_9PROT|nr:MBL fold metallo-hydrolase [Marinimicrococcus flavescens]